MSDEQVKGIERFDAEKAVDVCGNFDVLMRQRHDGLFVRFADHEQALAALEARNKELESALRGIESLCADEITTRFGGHSHKSEDELGRNSRVYSLLVVPRNMARAALKGAS